MKKITLSVLAIFALTVLKSEAQTWSGSTPGNIYYNSGNVGIGTAPLAALHVVGGTNQGLLIGTAGGSGYPSWMGTNGLYADGSIRAFAFVVNGGSPVQWGSGRAWIGGDDNGTTNSYLSFTTGRTAVQAERMRITDNGYVGIGITNPSTKLDVDGVIRTTDQLQAVGGGGDLRVNGNFGGSLAGIGLVGNNPLMLFTSNTERMRVDGSGNISIGTTDTKGYKLAVNGDMIATSVKVKLYSVWPDYVFKPTYKLTPLAEVKTYIDKNQHLPEMPSAEDVEKEGLNLGEMNRLLLKKVEELTLYLIEKDTENKQQQIVINQMNLRLNKIEKSQLEK